MLSRTCFYLGNGRDLDSKEGGREVKVHIGIATRQLRSGSGSDGYHLGILKKHERERFGGLRYARSTGRYHLLAEI
jgi:hypothetical protein